MDVNRAKELVRMFYQLYNNDLNGLQKIFDAYHAYSKEIEYMAADVETNRLYLAIDRLYRKSIVSVDEMNYTIKQQNKKEFRKISNQQQNDGSVFVDIEPVKEKQSVEEKSTVQLQENSNFLF
ncbi:hypothetical protein [Desulfurella multipotens]|uniref:hypothetical protein n=1 Tax=Desulfurella multipotens TaxID=79269 RepID=UPI000CB18EBC|nr:hypothetical protein [Desulfurella multipotens]PMP68003.1 MAG: hypothetical protein C0192_02505 [Desulfurella multipotens]